MLVANGLFDPFFGPNFGCKIMLLNRPPGNWCWFWKIDHIVPIYSLHEGPGTKVTEVDFEEMTILVKDISPQVFPPCFNFAILFHPLRKQWQVPQPHPGLGRHREGVPGVQAGQRGEETDGRRILVRNLSLQRGSVNRKGRFWRWMFLSNLRRPGPKIHLKINLMSMKKKLLDV